MSDGATSGSAMLAGNPAGDGASAGTMVGGEAAPAAPNTPPAGDAPAANANWFDGIPDADLKGYVQNKGWKDPADLAVGYRNLEKLLGSEKVPLPKGADDKEGWGRVYDALGRPKAAEDYKLPVPEGGSPDFAKAAAGKFHELGLSANQAQALTEWYNSQAAEQTGAMQQQSAQKVEADLQSLKSEWGPAWNENINLGQRAAKEFGLDAEKLNAMENAFGTGEMLKFMARIGRGLTEHTFEGGKSTQGFGMTPDAAKARISQLREDREWSTRYISGNADARSEMAKLMAVAYPE